MRSTCQKLFVALASSAFVTAASAGDYVAVASAGDYVYADSFGNLVIHSPAGYKRIIVGEGHLAKELSDFTSAGQPEIVYLDEADRVVESDGCYRPPWLLKGRSYMYGFDEGEIPFQGGPCQ
jgi:hypothetical protein